MNTLFPESARTTPAIAVCWGAGVDSTAMLIEMERRGIRPDLITFADATTYWKGDKARYTGQSEILYGQRAYELELLEGHRTGERVWTYHEPAN